jgi:hypothetical protein
MMQPVLDHLVVGALDLDDGVAYVQHTLGVAPSGGGRHVRMGTHNRVLGLGESCNLEVLAVDPEGRAPGRPRWFELDTEEMQALLAEGPRLITWVARAGDIMALYARSAVDLGVVLPMERGALSWRITVPPDGRLNGGGLIPPVIQWDDEPHPAFRMTPSGCTLVGLEGFHPDPARIQAGLRSLGLEEALTVQEGPAPPRLRATIETPDGLRVLT